MHWKGCEDVAALSEPALLAAFPVQLGGIRYDNTMRFPSSFAKFSVTLLAAFTFLPCKKAEGARNGEGARSN